MPAKGELDSRAFRAALNQRMAELAQNARREEERLGNLIAEATRARMPKDTGATAASVRVSRDDQGVEVRAGGAALPLEFGTSKMSPRPSLRPSLAEARVRFRPPGYR